MKKKRIELIDMIKAIMIFCIIWGHAVANGDTSTYRVLMYKFGMPLFFFLAGMSMKVVAVRGKKGWTAFLKKNFLALMVPYFIWGMIYSQTTYDNIRHLLYGCWEGLNAMNTLTSLWFLPCLFVARMIVQFVINIVEKISGKHREPAYLIAAVISSVIGLLLPHGEGWFWGTDIAFVAAGFILAGVLLKRRILIMAQQKGSYLTAGLAVTCLMYFGAAALFSDSLNLMGMHTANYGNIFWLYYYVVFGSLIVILIAMLIERIAHEGIHPFSVGYVTFVGKHTMGIYLLHKPILQNLVFPFISGLLPQQPVALQSLISAIIMMPLCCGMCIVIERFIPELLGDFPRESTIYLK